MQEARDEVFRLRSERQLQQSERLASLGTLAAGVAHEVNNALNAVLLNAMVGAKASALDDAKGLFDNIVADVKRGAAITQKMIAFARADELEPVPTALAPVVETARDHMRHELSGSDVRCDIKIPNDLGAVEIDPIAFQHVITNMIQNSINAGAENIAISAESTGDTVKLRISDDGHGIEEESAEEIFEPFFTTRRSEGGSGLGLSFAHRFIAELGGTIVATRCDSGAEFSIELRAKSDR